MENIVFRNETVTLESDRYVAQNGSVFIHDHPTYVDSEHVELLSRENTPDFIARKKRGDLLPINLYSRVSLSSEYISGHFTSSNPNGGNPLDAYFLGKPTLGEYVDWRLLIQSGDSIPDNDEIQYAVQKAAAKFYSGGFDALTFLAEFSQLVRMFAGLVPDLVGLIRKTPPINFGRKLAEVDLQVRYGWRTFFYDLEDIKKVLDKLNKSDKTLFKATSLFGATVFIPPTPQSVVWDSGIWTGFSTTSVNLSYKGLVYGTNIPPKVTVNPLITAWEVVRLSFIIDWFINIGQWLAALQFAVFHPDHVSGGGFHLNIVRQTTMSAGETGSVNPTFWWTPSGEASFLSILDKKFRTPMAVPKTPKWKVRLDGWKIVDLLALITLALLSKGK